MITWVIYDISEDAVRTKVAKHCQKKGLYRVQNSVFLGTLEPNEREDLALQLQEWIDEGKDRIYLSPLSHDDFAKLTVLGRDFDRQLVSGSCTELLF